MSIIRLTSLAQALPADLQVLFSRIYRVHSKQGRLELPGPIHSWVEQKFGQLPIVEGQTVTRVDNLITLEGTLYNELRSRRPLEKSGGTDLDNLVDGYQAACPFCRAEEQTPLDIFGRIEGRYCLTASNIAKYDGWHGLVIPHEHHPLRFNLPLLQDYLEVAGQWFGKVVDVEKEDYQAWYCFLMWNCLWPAGSSVVHGHLQLAVTHDGHYPAVERLRRAAAGYAAAHGSNYFEDLYRVHRALGLGLELAAGVRAMAVLTPVKEREIWLLAPAPGDLKELAGLAPALHQTLRLYLDELGVNSYNMALYIPPLGSAAESWAGFPAIIRLVDRGDALGRTADMGGMELFAASVVSSDPFGVAAALHNLAASP